MGCVQSSQNVPSVAERRRRLSVGEIKGSQEEISPEAIEQQDEARGFLKEVNDKTLLQMISDDNIRSRKFSIGYCVSTGGSLSSMVIYMGPTVAQYLP